VLPDMFLPPASTLPVTAPVSTLDCRIGCLPFLGDIIQQNGPKKHPFHENCGLGQAGVAENS
ncbi:MAG: hypothetical protein WC359_14725, partial [Dehalococcoidia bacterium]